MSGWFRRDENGALVTIHARPNAKSTAVTGAMNVAGGGQALGVRLAAKPVDGAANKALTDLIARELGLAKTTIRLVAGQNSRTKRLHVGGKWDDLEPRLNALTGSLKP